MARYLLFFTLLTAIGLATVHLAAGVREERARSLYPAKGKLIDIEGVEIHAEIRGDGPDLVLLHGASGNTRDFTFSLADSLAERYRVIMMDRPGLGWSDRADGYGGAWNTAGESPRAQARLLKSAADQLGVSKPLVLGHSFGGAVAMAWALEYPDDTAGLVMLAAVSHPWPGELDWLYPVNASAIGGALFVPLQTAFVPGSYVDKVVDSIFEPQSAPDGYTDHVGAGLTLRRSALRANARQVNGLRPHVVEMSEEYPSLSIPIEIVHGDADTIVPLTVHSQPLADRVTSATLTVLPGVGHMPHHADPKAVMDAIDRAAQRAGLR